MGGVYSATASTNVRCDPNMLATFDSIIDECEADRGSPGGRFLSVGNRPQQQECLCFVPGRPRVGGSALLLRTKTAESNAGEDDEEGASSNHPDGDTKDGGGKKMGGYVFAC